MYFLISAGTLRVVDFLLFVRKEQTRYSEINVKLKQEEADRNYSFFPLFSYPFLTLCRLYLSYNRLSSLPLTLGNLTNLTM